MTSPGEEPQDRPAPRPGSYDEIAPGVPRYGQYAPPGWEPPQQPNAESTVPAAPAYPGFAGTGAPDEHISPPRQLLLAARLISIAGILQFTSVVALLIVLFVPALKASIVSLLHEAMADVPGAAELYADQAMVNTVLIMAFVISLAMAVSYFWLARGLRRGSNGARITSLVLSIISLMFLAQPNPLTMIQVALGIAGVVLVFRSPSKEFFTHKRGIR